LSKKNPENKKYRLGLKIIDLANRALSQFDVRAHAALLMKKLSVRLEEIVHLSVLDKNEFYGLTTFWDTENP
jgi:DNA-binding IclR family transcriptional regulator